MENNLRVKIILCYIDTDHKIVNENRQSAGPVSYTHLDVYKRQVHYLRHDDFNF